MQRVAVLRRRQRHAVDDASLRPFKFMRDLESLVAAVPCVLEGEMAQSTLLLLGHRLEVLSDGEILIEDRH